MSSCLEQIESFLASSQKIVIVGIGSVLRSDDAAGVVAIERLSERLPLSENSFFSVIDGSTAVESVTGEIVKRDPDLVIFIDAAELGLPAGGLSLVEEDDIGGVSFSTHMLPLKIIINYLRISLPETRMVVIGIQPLSLDFSADVVLSPKVDDAVEQVVGAFSDFFHRNKQRSV